MKVSDIVVAYDEATFQPWLTATVSIPLETLQVGTILMSEDEFATIIGKELLLQLKTNVGEINER